MHFTKMIRRVPIYQVDAFTSTPFRGNPAAVCVLSQELSDQTYQAIAAEMNLSETAFVRPLDANALEDAIMFELRWFTPAVEVNLCGHATLATAHVMFNEMELKLNPIRFQTRSGELRARSEAGGIVLDFPAGHYEAIRPHDLLLDALGITDFDDMVYSDSLRKLLIRLKSRQAIQHLQPDFAKMIRIHQEYVGVIVTAPDDEYDFVSRFFAPWVGVNEDPVTGSAHTVLATYWSAMLGKIEMRAYQASARGGEMTVRLIEDDRVELVGEATTVLSGLLNLVGDRK